METTASKEASGKGSRSASPSTNSTARCSASARIRPRSSRAGTKSVPTRLTPPPCRGEGQVSAPGGDVQDAPAGLQVSRLAELFGLVNDSGGDHRKIAAGPGRLLTPLDGGIVRGRLWAGAEAGIGS